MGARDMPFRTKKGIALPFVLLVIALLLVIVSSVAVQGLGALRQAKVEEHSKQSLFAAEAGAADALRTLVEDPTFAGSIPNGSLPGGSTYTGTVYNNFSGTTSQNAPNGAEIPAGTAYIYGTGSFASLNRKVGILVSPGSAAAFGMALGSGGEIRMQGSKTVRGSVKSNQDIRFQGSTRILPIQGSGRVLSSQNVRSQGSTRVDDAQDVRARGSVNDSPAIRGALAIQSGDTTDSTLPFITNYRDLNSLNPGDQGLVLPNPNYLALTDTSQPNIVDGVLPVPDPFDLNGQVHVFNASLSFSGSQSFTGTGTIVVTGGNSIEFQGSTNFNGNLIAIRDPAQYPNGGSPTIRFQGSSTVSGLVYAHEGIRCQGSCTINGAMIAYRNGGAGIRTQGSTNITLDSSVFANIPGFGPWASGFGGLGGIPAGSGPLSVLLWERF